MEMMYDRNGAPIDWREWGRLHSDPTYIRVARSKIVDLANPDQVFDVSTVWLGLDHSWGDGPPLIFETMVFCDDSLHDEEDEEMDRYATEDQARAGHISMIARVASELTDPTVIDIS